MAGRQGKAVGHLAARPGWAGVKKRRRMDRSQRFFASWPLVRKAVQAVDSRSGPSLAGRGRETLRPAMFALWLWAAGFAML
ncbi:hypothetical protein AAU61_11650 [Desulfocarbo indianensis]|nr:hypothetical protein AAU61_11650 [Desulfocarbo indianensis]